MLLDKNRSVLLLIDVQEKLTPFVLNWEQCIERCQWLLRLASRMNVPVLASEQYPQGLGPTIPELSALISRENCIDKVHFSCAGQPTYLQKLKQLNRNQLILIGIEAHVCVLQTALDLNLLGFEVSVVVDATSSRKEIDLRFGLKRMKQSGVDLLTSEMVFFEWIRYAGTPEFKALSKEFLK